MKDGRMLPEDAAVCPATRHDDAVLALISMTSGLAPGYSAPEQGVLESQSLCTRDDNASLPDQPCARFGMAKDAQEILPEPQVHA